MKGKILIVDDEPEMLISLQKLLGRQGYDISITPDSRQAISLVSEGGFDLLLADVKMPDIDGVSLLKEVKRIQPDLIVILITGYARVETAVEAMREGAFDFLEKPFSPNQIEVVISRAFMHRRLTVENQLLRAQIKEQYGLDRIIGKSPEILKVFEMIRKIARSDMDVLIIGESGTGKELIANAIHLNSNRHEKPFIPVDCGAIVDSLMESELFGYVKGAFTGATLNKTGLIEMANGGSLFLDEVGELSPSLQVKLLRTLQERTVRPVGGRSLIPVDIRIIAATNRDLRKEVLEGKFREDLFHRLNVFQLTLPPLRQRKGDIPVLAAHFLRQTVKNSGRPVDQISESAMKCLESYDWPGNIRELKNIIDRAVFLTDDPMIQPKDLPDYVRAIPIPERSEPIPSDLPFKEAKQLWVEAFERQYLIDLLRHYHLNISHAADAAQIDRKSIQRMMKRYGISVDIQGNQRELAFEERSDENEDE